MKKYAKYIFLFTYFFVCIQFIYTSYSLDTYANYGFSYALVNGQIPYLDFNLIVPLFSPFLYSLGLIFNHSIIIMFIEQALLLTLFSYVIFRSLNNKAFIVIFCMLLPFPIPFVFSIFPGYNFILYFIYVLLITSKEDNDKLIGLLLGFAILTKQTIGLLFLLTNVIYYWKRPKKLIKRLSITIAPIIIFIIYLLLNNNFNDFFNMCILGIFDFSGNNTHVKIIYVIIFIIVFSLSLLSKNINKKSINFWYYLSYSFIVFPMIDSYHTGLFILGFLVYYLYESDSKIKHKNIGISLMLISITISISWLLFTLNLFKNKMTVYNFTNSPMRLYMKSEVESYQKINKYLSNNNKKIICLFLNNKNILFYTNRNEPISYYSLLNKGNYGYNGEEKVLNKLKNEKDVIILTDTSIKLTKDSQYISELEKYVSKNCKLIKTIDEYKIYYKK